MKQSASVAPYPLWRSVLWILLSIIGTFVVAFFIRWIFGGWVGLVAYIALPAIGAVPAHRSRHHGLAIALWVVVGLFTLLAAYLLMWILSQ